MESRKRLCVGWVVCSIAIGIAISAATSVTLRYYASGDYSEANGLQYGPIDTRIISYSRFLCQKLQISINTNLVDSRYNVSLYMLHLRPNLNGYDKFSTRGAITLEHLSAHDYYYYFYPGSKVTISACVRSSNNYTATFYLIEGSRSEDRYKDSFEITTGCAFGSNTTKSYRISAENYYYLVFRNNHNASVVVEIELSVLHTHYEIENSSSIIESCSNVSSEKQVSLCSVDVPLSSAVAYMAIQPYHDHNVRYWDSELYIHTMCTARYWMYAVISVAVTLAVICALNSVVMFICMTHTKNRRRKHLVPIGISSDPTTPLVSDSPSFYQRDSLGSYGSRRSITPSYSSFTSY